MQFQQLSSELAGQLAGSVPGGQISGGERERERPWAREED